MNNKAKQHIVDMLEKCMDVDILNINIREFDQKDCINYCHICFHYNIGEGTTIEHIDLYVPNNHLHSIGGKIMLHHAEKINQAFRETSISDIIEMYKENEA